jgi:alpha-galactosidase
MRTHRCGLVMAGVGLACMAWPGASARAQERLLAATPPMGWNSWDAYGESVKESDIRATAEWMAKNLKPFGWEYVVVDSGWYVKNHAAGYNATEADFSLDEFGRYTPAVNTIPSAAGESGFKPLADYLHSLGLKFGLHILRGIPKEATAKNLPIEGTNFHAQDAADPADTCPWNPFNYGLDTRKPAAQAYYDSLARQFTAWGVDFVKVDCIASHPYKGEEIRLLSQALRQANRPMVLSLSPGPAPLEKAGELAAYAHLWRISDDEWDVWQSSENFPQGVNNQFERAADWAIHARPGNWPDADMLAVGELKPAPGWGEPRRSRLTKQEQRTLLTLWSIARSPLMIGGNLLLCDDWTKSLLTNRELLAVDQHSKGNHAVETNANSAAWVGVSDSGPAYYVAVFNRSGSRRTLHYDWRQLGIRASECAVRDLWEHRELGSKLGIDVTLPPHGSVLYSARRLPHVVKSGRTSNSQ